MSIGELIEKTDLNEADVRKLIAFGLGTDDIVELATLDKHSKLFAKPYVIEHIIAVFANARALVEDCGKSLIDGRSAVDYDDVADEIIQNTDSPFIITNETYYTLRTGKIVRFSVDPEKRFTWC